MKPSLQCDEQSRGVTRQEEKFLPWVRLVSILIPVATLFIFIIPANISTDLKIALAAITYVIWDLAYTIGDVPIFALATSMTDHLGERKQLVSYGRIASIFGYLFVGIAVTLVIGDRGNYAGGAAVGAVAALLFMLPVGFRAKERFRVKEEKEGASLKDFVHYIAHNKFLLIFNAGNLVYGMFKVSFVLLGVVVALLILHFYKLKDADVQIMTDINGGKISRENGEKLLSRSY